MDIDNGLILNHKEFRCEGKCATDTFGEQIFQMSKARNDKNRAKC